VQPKQTPIKTRKKIKNIEAIKKIAYEQTSM